MKNIQKPKSQIENQQKTGLFNIIKIGGLTTSAIINSFSLISLLLAIILLQNINFDRYKYIVFISNTLLDIIPSILGFSIAAYSFLMAFIPKNLMIRISKKTNHFDESSLYQKITASLAMNSLQHIAILIITLLIQFSTKFQDLTEVYINQDKINSLNYFGVCLITVLLGACIGVLCQVIVSSFNIAQLNHYEATRDVVLAPKYTEEKK
jgi:hypothetical protein